MNQTRAMRLSTKLLLISELVLLVLAVALLVPVRQQMRNQVIEDMQRELRAIAATAALQIDGDLHVEVARTTDPEHAAFIRLRDQLDEVRLANGLTPDNIYTFYSAGPGQLRFGVMTQDPFIGDPYESRPHETQALREGEVTASELYTDEYGQWISAAAPIRSSTGEIVGLLEVNQHADRYFKRYHNVIMVNTIIALVALAISSLLGWYVLNKLIIRPVTEIHGGLQALGRHDFTHRVRVKTRDEFQELGDTLNSLFDQLNVAQSIQNAFFPEQLPMRPGYRIAAASEPCEATGGDYYDAFNIDEQRTAILVADVTGHGLGPSLIMASCRSALHALSSAGLEPGPLLQRLETQLASDLTQGRFITMIFGVLGPDGSFTYANAGHAPAMVVRRDTVQQLDSHRPPLGIQIDLDDEDLQSTVHLEPGDRILFASDGVNEAQDPANQQFGVNRIETIVRDRSLVCQQVVNRLQDDLSLHRAGRPASDDVTILCVDRV